MANFLYLLVFPGGSDNKEPVCDAGDLCDTWVREVAPEKGMAAHSSILPGNPMDRRSLASYNHVNVKSQTRFQAKNHHHHQGTERRGNEQLFT